MEEARGNDNERIQKKKNRIIAMNYFEYLKNKGIM